MRKLLLSLILVFSAGSLFAQSTGEKAVKVYLSIKNQSQGHSPLWHVRTREVLPSFGLSSITTRGNFHEIQFLQLTLQRHRDYNFSVNSTFFSFRYSYTLALFRGKSPAIQPLIGFAAAPYYSSEKFTPLNSTNFGRSSFGVGTFVELVPRINWNINEKLFLDLNLPLRLADLSYLRYYTNNPQVPEPQQTSSGLDFNTLPRHFEINLGLGIKI